MANYTTDTTITSNLADAEDLQISGDNVTVTIDASVFIPTMKYGRIIATTTGKWLIKNSTNNMLLIDLADITDDMRIEGNGQCVMEGGWIEIATGDGTAGQTIDFSTIGDNNVSIDHPCAVWVEEEPGGKLVPFLSLGDASVDRYPLYFAGDSTGVAYGGIAGDWDRGRFYTFNRTTRIATFGDGTNGHVIPNGCRVFFPNIHLTCSSFPINTSYGTRPLTDTTANGTLIWDKVSIGYFRFYSTAAQVIDLSYISCDSFGVVDCYTRLVLDNIACSPMTISNSTAISQAFALTDFQGVGSRFSNFYIAGCANYGTSNSTPTLAAIYGENNALCENMWGMWVDRRNNTDTRNATGLYFARYYNTTIKNVVSISGSLRVNGDNNQILNIQYGGTPFVPDANATFFPTKYRTDFINLSGSNNVMIGGSMIAGDSLASYYGFQISNILGSNNQIYQQNLNLTDYSAWVALSTARIFSDNTVIKNCVINGNTGSVRMEVDAVGLTIDNVRGMTNTSASLRRGVKLNMTSIPYTYPNPGFGTPMYLRQSHDELANEGWVSWQFAPPIEAGDYEHSYTGQSSYFNNAYFMYIESGASITISNQNPIKGLTAFRDIDYKEAQGPDTSTELTIEVEMVNAGQSFTGNFTTLTFDSSRRIYTAMQSLLDGLTNYDSNKGLNMRVRMTNLVSSLQYFTSFDIPCYIDTNYQSSDAYVTIEGGSDIDQYEMRKKSDTSVLFSWTGVGRYDFPLGSLEGEEVYFVRYVLSDGTYDRAASNKPFPITLGYGNNGIVKLYVGNEIQVASSDPSTIWNYTTRSLTEGTYTDEDRAKALTTGKFLALK